MGRYNIANAHECCKQVAKFKYFVSNNYAYKPIFGEKPMFSFKFSNQNAWYSSGLKINKRDLFSLESLKNYIHQKKT